MFEIHPPYRTLVVGTSQSGKTTLVSALLTNLLKNFSPKQTFVILHCSMFEYANVFRSVNVERIRGVKAVHWEELKEVNSSIIVFEDTHGLGGVPEYTSMLNSNTKKSNVIITIAHCLFDKTKDSAFQRRCYDSIVLFPDKNYPSEFTPLIHQLFMNEEKVIFKRAVETCYKNPYMAIRLNHQRYREETVPRITHIIVDK